MEKNKINENEIDQELHEHFSFNVDKGQEPLRIDKFLMNRIENATRNKIQNAAKDGYIRVNQNPVKSSYKVKKGDKIKILFTHPPYENLLTPENIDLDIVFEDDSIIIINKPIRKTDVDVVIVISLNTNKTGFEYRIDHDAIISKTINWNNINKNLIIV